MSRAVVTALVCCLLALHAWLALVATIDLGFTADETAHLTSGYSYWRFNDYRLQPENGNLPQRWAALPLLAQSPRLEPAEQADFWQRSHVWRIAQHFLFESGNNTDYLLFTARAMMLCWGVATGLLVFFWSRGLWGDRGAVLSLALYSVSPTMLAHAPLVTSDMCAAFWLLAATGAWGRLTRGITTARLAVSLLAAGLAAVAKFSSVLLLPVVVLIALQRIWSSEPMAVGQAGLCRSRLAKLGLLLGLAILHVLFAWLVVWASFGFRYDPCAPELPMATKYFVAWADLLPDSGVSRWLFDSAREHHLLPDAYLQGFAYVLWAAQQRGAFAAGLFSTTGWWWFFPYAFLVKSSIAEVLAVVLILAAALGRPLAALRAILKQVWPLLVLAAVYGAFSVSSHLNIGHRHILPLYPVLFILAGSIARPGLRLRGTIGGAVLLVIGVWETFTCAPHYLAFFNSLSGGPTAGWRHLVDSSLDWGQNVPRLARWLQENRRAGEPVYLSLFGSDDPFYHGITGHELAPYYSFGRKRRWIELEPGVYCISATMLQDVYSPFAGTWTAEREASYRRLLRMMRAELSQGRRSPDLGEFGEGPEQPLWNLDRARFARLCLYLRARKPDADIGHSILVYRLNASEVQAVVDGSFDVLATSAQSAADTGAQGN